MSYTNVYPSRINWENEPSIASPINATNLNKLDYAAYEFDQTFATWDITKANQSDLLLSVKSIDYDTETGVFVFTWQNGTTKTVDLNIEKIPVSFSMSAQGVITMTTDDGTTYTADVGSLIKTYTFTDSSVIDFTVTTDASGNKTVTADIVDGSITGTKLQPNYLADCQSAKTGAETAEDHAEDSAEDSEAWAVGTRDGVPVPSSDPAYNNNAKYWAQHTTSSFAGLTDTDITNPQNGQVPVYNSTSQKWENADQSAGGGSTIKVTTSESSLFGRTVTITCGTYTESGTFSNSGEVEFTGVTATGNFTITSSTSGGDTATASLSVPYFGNYTKALTLFSATITVTYPSGATCTISDGTTTLNATSNPMAFDIPNAGTWRATATLDGIPKQGTAISITTDGQTATDTITFGTINLTYTDDFKGLTITCVNGGTTISKQAPSNANAMVFYPPTTGEWVISGTVGGTPYSTSATITSLSTPESASLQTVPDGSTVTPTDDIQIWLKCATINDKSYTTLNEVLADTDTFTALLQDSNACDYMARSTTWSTTICADADAMRRVGMYDYCSCALLGNSTWASAIVGSAYWDSVLKGLVPIMTSDSTPSGAASSSYNRTGYEAYKAFDNDSSTYWMVADSSDTNQWLKYDFGYDVDVFKVLIRPAYISSNARLKNVIIQASSDDSTYVNIASFLIPNANQDNTYSVSASTKYRYWKMHVTDCYGATIGCATLQFYGRKAPQTNIIHSAASDTLYYIDGTSQTIGTTDTSGVGTVNWSNVPVGNLTIYSSVANNPDDLTSAYSKTVRITPHTVEVYVMPDNALYWYGYQSSNCESMTSANGWSGGYNGSNPTYNTNDIYVSGTCGIGVKNSITLSKLHSIAKATALYDAIGIQLNGFTTKSGSGSAVVTYLNNNTLNTVVHSQTTATNTPCYPFVRTPSTTANGYIYAMWYE